MIDQDVNLIKKNKVKLNDEICRNMCVAIMCEYI